MYSLQRKDGYLLDRPMVLVVLLVICSNCLQVSGPFYSLSLIFLYSRVSLFLGMERDNAFLLVAVKEGLTGSGKREV